MSHLQRYLEGPGAFPSERLAAALRRQQIYGGSLDTALLELELVEPTELGGLLMAATGLPTASVEHLVHAGERPWHRVPQDLLQLGWAVPLVEAAGELWVAVHPDLPDDRLGALYRTAPGVRVVVAPECCLEKIAAERDASVVPQRFAVLSAAYVAAVRAHGSAARMAPAAGAPSPAIELPRTLPRLTLVEGSGSREGDDALPEGVPRGPLPRHGSPPPVRFSARGTPIAIPERQTAPFEEARAQRALAEPRRALLGAQTSDEALAAFLRAASVITTRLVLFRRDGTTLRALACRTSTLDVPVGACWDIEHTPASTVLHALRWAGDTADPALQALLGYDDAYPCLMCSIVVAHQALMVLYADHGGREFVPGEAAILLDLCRDVGAVFERLLLPGDRARPSEVAPPPAFGTTPVASSPLEAPPEVAPEPVRPAPASAFAAPHRPPSSNPPPLEEQESSGIIPLSSPIDQPSVRGRILLDDEDWTGPSLPHAASEVEQRRIDAVLDSIARGEHDHHALLDFGDPGLARLAAVFPGPLDVLRRDLRALPPPSAHGPLVRVAIAIGHEFVPHVLERFTHPDPEVRFYAAFLFQELRDPACMLPLSRLAFDGSADVRVIAMRVLETYARYPRFGDALALVRDELGSSDRNHQLYAARAVGTLRDVAAIETLVELLSSRDRFIQEAALESLCSITGQQHGLKPHRWKNWYAEHRDRHRIEWIIDSLRHRDLPVRRWAHDELVRVTGHRIPFSPLGDRQSRDVAARAWTDWWVSAGHQHFRESRSKPR